MATYSLRLDFVNPEAKGFPSRPFAHIALKTYSTNEDGSIHISWECRTPKEIDECVELLKRDLDAISKEAKRKFTAALKKPFVPKKK